MGFLIYIQEPVGVSKKNKNKASTGNAMPIANESSVAARDHLQLSGSRRIYSLANCSAQSKQQFELFQNRELLGHTGSIVTTEFPGDERFLVSGDPYKSVKLWSLSQSTRKGHSPISCVYLLHTP